MKLAVRDAMPVKRIQEMVHYDPSTGSFTWKSKARHNMPAIGKKAGGVRNKYYYIRIDEIDYPASRIAWAIMNDSAPIGRIAFKDKNPLNLKWDNLVAQFFIKGYDTATHEGKRAYGKAYRAANPDKEKARGLKDSFGINLRQYEDMLIAQKGKCAICERRETMKRKGKDVALAVDHCHENGAVRGLLCTACNKAIGLFGDDIEIIQSAIRYLAKHKKQKLDNVVSLIAKKGF